jgi:hypothetical protein
MRAVWLRGSYDPLVIDGLSERVVWRRLIGRSAPGAGAVGDSLVGRRHHRLLSAQESDCP